jgi:glyoxylase-like metal-dependent hydrolase (beta-lactamase superfamily II)
MELISIASRFTAFIRPEVGANVGMLHTSEGMVLIDTASSPAEILTVLSSINARPEEVRMVVNTHFHSDHTWGNQVFSCPIMAQRLCQERMRSSLKNEWSPKAFKAYLASLEKTDPQKAVEFSGVVQGLQIRLPDRVFEGRFLGEIGGVNFELVHMGGHTPDSSIVWLPETRVLYASDLIFQGRYPFVFDADIPAWIEALKRLLEFEADVIIPGHGVRCGKADILWLIDYLQHTWQLTKEHIQLGHNLEKTCADPAYPIFAEGKREKLHAANIRYMYEQITASSFSIKNI